ncbi:putative metalloprotease domain protein [Acinetobacter baumannii 1428368]|nr:putative metalloprotease domain protein [Acinetobacter baumannii 1428368]
MLFDGDELKDKTYHVLSWLLPQASDIKLRLGMRLVEGVYSKTQLHHFVII